MGLLRWGLKRVGEEVAPQGRPLAVVHARDEASAEAAAHAVRVLVAVGDGPPAAEIPIVTEVVR